MNNRLDKCHTTDVCITKYYKQNFGSLLRQNLFCFSVLSHSTKGETKNRKVHPITGHQDPEGE